jgi:hypothetical protein
MRSTYLAVGIAGLVGIVGACGGEDHSPVAGDGMSGKSTGGKSTGGKTGVAGSKTTAGSDSLGGAGGEGGASDSPGTALAPTVVITSPAEVTDPNENGVLTASDVTVTCSVTQSTAVGSAKVNAAAVKLAILDAAGKVIEEKPAAPTGQANEFSTKFSLTALPSGMVGFTCKGEDTSKRSASDSVATFLDKGPTITIVTPVADSAHALSEALDIEFTVAATPLSDTDTHADVDADSITLEIASKPIDLSEASDKPGHYRLQVNLADPKLFNPAPTGPVPLLITATNQRTPKAITASLTEDVLVDGAGPIIKIVSPLDKAVVGGKVKLTFEATDAVSGVDPSTIVVALNMVDHPFDASSDSWGVNGNAYTFEFDSRQVDNAKVQITVNVGATDKVGNVSTGASELLYLDNYPPDIDLDPLNIRTALSPSNKCSNSFDPVGNAALNDLEQVARAGIFRALVVDQTNTDPEVPISHFSKTNPSSVRLYLQGDPTKPLLVDKDTDGLCDDVAEVDSTDSLALASVAKGGGPWYQNDAAAAPAAAALGCALPLDEAPKAPDHLCTANASDMWQVIQDEVNLLPIIYAASPTPNSLECTGVAWEFGGKLDADGWVCFATRAVDNAGNVGVSRPIRICVDDARAGTPACATQSLEPPSCTDGCTPQPRMGGYARLWK